MMNKNLAILMTATAVSSRRQRSRPHAQEFNGTRGPSFITFILHIWTEVRIPLF